MRGWTSGDRPRLEINTGAPTSSEGREPCEMCSGASAYGERNRSQSDPRVRRRDAPSKQTKGTVSSGGAERNGGLLGKAA